MRVLSRSQRMSEMSLFRSGDDPARWRHSGGRMKSRGPRRGRAWTLCLIAMVVLLTPMLISCSGSGPSVSGFALGNRRAVKRGEIVEIRMPLTEGGSRQWRVTSYDSLYLSMVESPRLEAKPDGSAEMIVRARAMTAGETELELTEVAPPGRSPDVRRFKISIRE